MLAIRLSRYAADNPTQLLRPALAAYRRQDPFQHLCGSGEELGCTGAQSNSFFSSVFLFRPALISSFVNFFLVKLHKLPQHSNNSWSVSSVYCCTLFSAVNTAQELSNLCYK